MNKRIIILGLIIVLVLSAAFFFLMPRTSPLNNNGNTNIGNNNTPSQNADLFTEALTGGGSVKCTFVQDGSAATAYVKQGKIRIDSTGTEGVAYGNAIVNGNMVYVWQTGNNTGMVIDTTSYQGGNGALNGQFTDPEKIKAEVEKSKPNCAKENVDDSIFTPPSTVKFTDYSKMMQQLQNPSGGNSNSQQYQQLLQQYAQ